MLRFDSLGPTLVLVSTVYSCPTPASCSLDSYVEVGPVPNGLCAMARTSQGTHYVFDCIDHTLGILDTEQATVDVLCTSSPDLLDIAFDDRDRPWVITGHQLARIEPDTCSLVDPVELGPTLWFTESITFLDGHLYGGNGSDLVEIDPASGQSTLIASHDGWIDDLRSDGDGLWAVLGNFGEPGPPPHYSLSRMDPISGAVVVVDYLPTSGYRPPGLTVARLPSPPAAVPELGLSALVVLITGLGLTGSALIWRLGQR